MPLSCGSATFAFSLLFTALPRQGADDPTVAARRLAATAELAAQEYRLGVHDGRVISQEELQEARLFLVEAKRTAGLLPPVVAHSASATIDSMLRMVDATASPDSIDARVLGLTAALAERLRISLDEIPDRAPSLARGAEVFRAECASCHGVVGKGDGAAAMGITPPPANLTDAFELRDRSPLDFYHRISIGVAGTAMPAFETRLSVADRWAVAAYASLLRLPAPRGEVPVVLWAFPASARMSDAAVLHALRETRNVGDPEAQSWLAAVRSYQADPAKGSNAGPVFIRVREQIDSSLALAREGRSASASAAAFDAYMTFEQIERSVRARNATLATDLETRFAALRTRAAGGASSEELSGIRESLAAGLENAERLVGDRLSPINLFAQSFIILLREGLEAILVIGALMTFLMKTGAAHRKREIHVGVGAAVVASLLTALLLETLFQVTPSHREALEGITMMVAVVVLFCVSYWLLSKMEVAKWNRFVRSKVEDAVSSGSALALATVAFLAVYREGFETVLFYKVLFLAGGTGTTVMPVLGGIAAGAVVLGVVYVGINRFGVRLPLKPFFGVTSAFLYYMAFVFAGKGVAELQEGGLLPTTIIPGGPRIPALGIYPTSESLALQGVLAVLLVFALLWTFVFEPRRLRVTSAMVPEPTPPNREMMESGSTAPPDLDVIRSLERMDADLAELRAEVSRLKGILSGPHSRSVPRS